MTSLSESDNFNLDLDQLSDEELFTDSFSNLKQAFLKQSASQRRVAVRVKFLIRSLMIAIVTSLLFIFYLIYILTHQVTVLTNELDSMSIEGQMVLKSMSNIDSVMMKFEAHMNSLPYINESVSRIDDNLSLVEINVAGISDNLGLINGEVNQLSKTLGSMSSNIEVLDYTVHQVNKDINDATKPIQRFNDFNPFNYMK
ncbi:MAG: hypothetical protein V3U84_02435 [Thiotrichaceae bacterium]